MKKIVMAKAPQVIIICKEGESHTQSGEASE